jgi:2,3-dihydroxybiphenyl 1,2-dioxygenase
MNESISLAYTIVEGRDVEAFDAFATHILGVQRGASPAPDVRSYRLDEKAQRILVRRGAAEDIAAVGFEAPSPHAFEAAVARARAAGAQPQAGTDDEARIRQVAEFAWFADPEGNRIELCHGLRDATEPFQSELMPAGFKTGALGMGHYVLITDDRLTLARFYTETLGMRLSDTATDREPIGEVSVSFLRATPRHHTVGFAQAPIPFPRRLHHIMIEANDLDDVGASYERALAAGAPIANHLGRHLNDRMFSYYVVSPLGFFIEVGQGGLEVDEATWRVEHVDRFHSWGHRPGLPVPAAIA